MAVILNKGPRLAQAHYEAGTYNAIAGGIANVGQLMFAIQQRRDQDRKENLRLAIPLLQLQAQMQRQKVADDRYAQSHAETMEFRTSQQKLAERAADRADAGLAETQRYHDWMVQQGLPEERVAKIMAEVQARTDMKNSSQFQGKVTPAESKATGVPVGADKTDMIGKTGTTPETRAAYASTFAILRRTQRAIDKLYTANRLRDVPRQAAEITKKGLVDGDPDAVFLDQVDGFLAQLARATGEKGSLATKDIDRAATIIKTSRFSPRARAMAKLDNAIGIMSAGARFNGLDPVNLLKNADTAIDDPLVKGFLSDAGIDLNRSRALPPSTTEKLSGPSALEYLGVPAGR